LKRNLIILLVVAVTVSAMIYTAATRTHVRTDSASVKTGALPLIDVQGLAAPAFTLNTLDGKPVSLNSLRGKAVLLNFWATWCGPCKEEMPWIVELQKKYKDQGLEVVGVAFDDTSNDKIADFAAKMKVNYTVLKGSDEVADNYGGVDGLPITFFIGRDGRIVEKSMGMVDKQDMEASIVKALAQGSSATDTNAAPAISKISPGIEGKK